MSQELQELADRIVAQAQSGEQVEAFVSRDHETDIRVYEGEVEHFVSAQSEGIGIRIIRDGRTGFAYAGTLDPSPPNRASHLALADGEWRDEALGFERTFLLFDNSRVDDARALWRTLAARDDVDNRFWKQDERGRWSEGP